MEHSHLLDINDLAVRLLQLPELRHEVPEATLADHNIGSEDGHLQKGGLRVLLRGASTANDHVLVQLKCIREKSETR